MEYLIDSRQAVDRAIEDDCGSKVDRAVAIIVAALAQGKPMVCGNGGSASDAMHITGALFGRFLKERNAINCAMWYSVRVITRCAK
ncbi:SIS domain-containing protein [Bradyrhizobium sp. 31Argb]|uniref:SIS domain-containing protein n=1 Tax=unclassified Bradyrhizobium TaxID=2631580 RepID=UPI00102EA0B2|nr:SIS domain-containing protein [Bradyrhizobium sp. Leo170]TAI66401.1 hypothetical protein CWO89_08365 [Bradyrhizobium sp. Leo170]